MLKMSSFSGTMNRNKLKQFIDQTDKPIRYTHGFDFKNPTTRNVYVTKNQALQIIDDQCILDAVELPDCLYLNSFSSADMW